MKLDVIRQAARSQPFKPFRLKLMNGTGFDVKRWERIVVNDQSVIRLFAKDHLFEIYRAEDIESLQYLPNSSSVSN